MTDFSDRFPAVKSTNVCIFPFPVLPSSLLVQLSELPHLSVLAVVSASTKKTF